MGEEEVKRKSRLRVVLDTSVFISALLFFGPPSRLVSFWQQDKFTLLISSEVLKEYLRVLSYPKFSLTREEIKSLIEIDVIPYSEPVRVQTDVRIVDRDPSDNKFLALALDGEADAIVSSDKHLLGLKTYKGIEILSAAEFLIRLKV